MGTATWLSLFSRTKLQAIGEEMTMSLPRLPRVSVIQKHLDPRKARILEIGALDSPTFRPLEYDVFYADYASREELSKNGERNPRYKYDRLVDVDYVVSGKRYPDIINEKFDLIIANHVIEHIPDVIGWLHDLGTLLHPDGMVFLSVPDRRYTFDIVRRESNFIDIIRPHISRQTRPDLLNILDHLWYYKQVKAPEIWEGTHLEAMQRMRFTHAECIVAAEMASRKPYADVHCHVFTELSFCELIEDLKKFGYFGFEELAIEPVIQGSNEFYVMLKKFNPSVSSRVIS
jgi:SAM-dependent methyltransferase